MIAKDLIPIPGVKGFAIMKNALAGIPDLEPVSPYGTVGDLVVVYW